MLAYAPKVVRRTNRCRIGGLHQLFRRDARLDSHPDGAGSCLNRDLPIIGQPGCPTEQRLEFLLHDIEFAGDPTVARIVPGPQKFLVLDPKPVQVDCETGTIQADLASVVGRGRSATTSAPTTTRAACQRRRAGEMYNAILNHPWTQDRQMLPTGVHRRSGPAFGRAGRKRPVLVASGYRYVRIVVLGAVMSVGFMQWALISNDFSLSYVANHMDRQTPLLYAIAGMWGALGVRSCCGASSSSSLGVIGWRGAITTYYTM